MTQLRAGFFLFYKNSHYFILSHYSLPAGWCNILEKTLKRTASMIDSLNNVELIQPSIIEDSFNNIGKGFQEILNDLERINQGGESIKTIDAFALQQSVFHYTFYQDTVTKIATKSANAINEVMKAQ